MINEEIESIFRNFSVSGTVIPVKFLYYQGHGEPYVVYMESAMDNSYSGDDDLLGYVAYYDFDVFSKGNYVSIVEAIKEKMKEHGWTWQVLRSSGDLWEQDTGYYHKTLCFAKHIAEIPVPPTV